MVPKVPKNFVKEGTERMYDTYDEEYKKQLNEIFGDGYGDGPDAEWETEEMEYKSLQDLERKSFEGRKGHGKEAPAFNDRIDNIAIMQLRDGGKSLDEIAVLIGCSKRTVKNRLNAMGIDTRRRPKTAKKDTNAENITEDGIVDENEDCVYESYVHIMERYDKELAACINKRATQRALANTQIAQTQDPSTDVSRLIQMQKSEKAMREKTRLYYDSPHTVLKMLMEKGL